MGPEWDGLASGSGPAPFLMLLAPDSFFPFFFPLLSFPSYSSCLLSYLAAAISWPQSCLGSLQWTDPLFSGVVLCIK